MSVVKKQSGVIWITGLSGSGKTTVSRSLKQMLEREKYQVISFDGDDLRKIFSETWGYGKQNRVELAKIYFRMCSYVSSQGYVVLISTVAMFNDIREWINDNIPYCLEVFLDVPEQILKERDENTKKNYANLEDIAQVKSMYDIPHNADLKIKNYGGNSPIITAQKVLDLFINKSISSSQINAKKKEYWKEYYVNNKGIFTETPFAEFVIKHLNKSSTILEVGCGNGRDSLFFSNNGHTVTAIDSSFSSIDLCKNKHSNSGITFFCGDAKNIKKDEKLYNTVYSRFVIHAMSKVEQLDFFRAAYNLLDSDGKIFIECRSVNDPMYRNGEVLSPTERIDGHYRRFIVLNELVAELKQVGFTIEYQQESNGLAIYGDEDPVVIRVIAGKLN